MQVEKAVESKLRNDYTRCELHKTNKTTLGTVLKRNEVVLLIRSRDVPGPRLHGQKQY